MGDTDLARILLEHGGDLRETLTEYQQVPQENSRYTMRKLEPVSLVYISAKNRRMDLVEPLMEFVAAEKKKTITLEAHIFSEEENYESDLSAYLRASADKIVYKNECISCYPYLRKN